MGEGEKERRIDVFVKMPKNWGGGGRVGGIRVDVNVEVKLL